MLLFAAGVLLNHLKYFLYIISFIKGHCLYVYESFRMLILNDFSHFRFCCRYLFYLESLRICFGYVLLRVIKMLLKVCVFPRIIKRLM